MKIEEKETSEMLTLRWSSYLEIFSYGLHEALESKSLATLADVTLACQGKRLEAHKIILAICSPFFQDLFQANPCPHPVVMMKDFKFSTLQQIITFVYCGVVNVAHEELTDFITTAQALQIKGMGAPSHCTNDQQAGELCAVATSVSGAGLLITEHHVSPPCSDWSAQQASQTCARVAGVSPKQWKQQSRINTAEKATDANVQTQDMLVKVEPAGGEQRLVSNVKLDWSSDVEEEELSKQAHIYDEMTDEVKMEQSLQSSGQQEKLTLLVSQPTLQHAAGIGNVSGPLNFLCCQCELKFSTQAALSSHMDTCHAPLPSSFKCIICKTQFKHKMSLQGHWWRYHKNEDPKLKEQCLGSSGKRKVSQGRVRLKVHIASPAKSQVDKNKYIKKDQCVTGNKRKQVHQRSSLGLKVRMFSPVKSQVVPAAFECKVCDKNFSSRGNLKTHIKKFHEVAADVENCCLFCEQKFSSKPSLLQHVLKVHGKVSANQCGGDILT